jgi:hypothetical protein
VERPQDLQPVPGFFVRATVPLSRKVEAIALFGDLSRDSGNTLNVSVEKVNPGLSKLLAGPLLYDALGNRSLDTKDFRYMADHLQMIYYSCTDMQGPQDENLAVTGGVKVCCRNDMELCHQFAYHEFRLPNSRLDQEGFKLPIGYKIDIPLIMIRLPESPI